MPTPPKGPRLGGGPAHEQLILANLATNLFEHKRITTTQARAQPLRAYAERLSTLAKRGELHSRRRVMRDLRDQDIVHELFTEIAEAVAERPGGYTRITKVGNRKGDNAPMAVIELVLEPYSPKQATVKEAEAAVKSASKPAPVADASAEASAAADSAADAGAADAGADAAPAEDAADSAAESAEGAEGADEAESADEK